MTNKYEFVEIVHLIEKSNPTSVEGVRKVLDDHFNSLGFSMLQHEWTNAMSNAQKDKVCEKLFGNFQQDKKRKSKLS